LGPNEIEFAELTQVYNTKPLDIKSVWATIPLKRADYIKDLLDKELIYPYLTLKNIDLIEEICIILPDVKKKFNDKILKIFSFFNIGFIHEIEGSFYINGFDDVIKFENGFMIILHLPDCQLDAFEKLFDLIFEYMEIDHYVILNDLVEGKPLLKSIYSNLDFLKEYNPLTNLIWNDKDKRWMNHQLFTKKFEPLYPDLFYERKFLCKRCGAHLNKGRICINCLYQLIISKNDYKEELRKVLNFEMLEGYTEILSKLKKEITTNQDSHEVKENIENNLNEFFDKLDIYFKRILNPLSYYYELK